MAKRVANIGVMVEYHPSTNKRQVANVGAAVEYRDTTNCRRVATIGVMVEYRAAGGRVYGPPAQMMG